MGSLSLSSGPERFRAVVAGDLRGLGHHVDGLRASAAKHDQVWALAVQAAAALIERGVAMPNGDELAGLLRGGTHPVLLEPADLVCAIGALHAFLRFDGTELAGWSTFHERVGGSRLALTRALSRFARGELEGLEADLAQLEATASKAMDAALTVEAASVRALVLLAQGDLGGAVTQARRASRMARTEGMPAQEYLAHLGLARVRRYQGRPSLATRILSSLATAAPPIWAAWITWEQLLSGGLAGGVGLLDSLPDHRTPAARAALALAELMRSAAIGDRARFEAIGASLVDAPFVWAAREVAPVPVLLDPEQTSDSLPEALASWARGDVDGPLPGLPGLTMPAQDDPVRDDAAGVWAVADPLTAPRRIVRASLALLDEESRIAQSRRRAGREDTALAVLLLAGGPLPVPEFFRRVYRFAYVAELHEGVLRVLVHRLKQRVEGRGRVMWESGSVALEIDGRVIVPDPRCSRGADERVLLALASRGRATAREVAGALGMPLRTVQAAIRELVEEGACQAEQRGRRVEYAVEDTTFSEPTRH